jgi:hypothetical protein
MTITFPRNMLCGGVMSSFRIAQGISMNRINSGITQVRQFAEPRWTAEITFAGFTRRKFQELEAWIDSLDGGLQDFYAHDPLKPYPVMYPKGTYPSGFAGGAGQASINAIAGTVIGVTGMPASFALKAGDHVGVIEGTKRGLFRIVEDFTGAGGALEVRPRIVPGQFTTGAFAQFTRPVCRMTIDISSLEATKTAGSASSIRFSAVQKIY